MKWVIAVAERSLASGYPFSFVDLIDVTLTCENANSKLVEVVTVADVDVVQVWKLKFGHKVNFLFRL